MSCTTMKRELWTGLVTQLPRHSTPPAELFARPSLEFHADGTVGSIKAHGLIDHAGWITLAELVEQAEKAGVEKLMLDLSSRAQEARGAFVAAVAVRDAATRIEITAQLLDCVGAAFAVAKCCQTVVVDPGKFRVGPGEVAYLDGGDGEYNAAHVQLLIDHLWRGRQKGDQELTEAEGEKAFSLLLDMQIA